MDQWHLCMAARSRRNRFWTSSSNRPMLPSCSLLSCSQLAWADLRSLAWWSTTCSQEVLRFEIQNHTRLWQACVFMSWCNVALPYEQTPMQIYAARQQQLKAQPTCTTHGLCKVQQEVECSFCKPGMVYQTQSNTKVSAGRPAATSTCRGGTMG